MSDLLAFQIWDESDLRSEHKMVGNGRASMCRERDLSVYLWVRFLSEVAATAQSVAVGWTVYRLSNAPMALGIIGIVQFAPMVLLTLPAGELCDRVSPRRVLAAGLALQGLCAIALLTLATVSSPALWTVYAAASLFGATRAFVDPAGQALLPLLVIAERLPGAIARTSSAWQVAMIAGATLGGLAYGLGPAAAYGICAASFLLAASGAAALGGRQVAQVATATLKDRLERVSEGLAFIGSRPIVLGAISLDLLAVLFGGATALLPVYARDILHVGPAGLGLLRGATAAGAVISALVQARHPPDRHVGVTLFAAVAVFGAATLIFAFSFSFPLSLTALVVLGASDMVSVNIRSSLVQLATPDVMRGRVSAVNMLFIGASSELGAFESGLAAALLGPVQAVAFGGLATLIVAAAWAKLFPALRHADRLSSDRRDVCR